VKILGRARRRNKVVAGGEHDLRELPPKAT